MVVRVFIRTALAVVLVIVAIVALIIGVGIWSDMTHTASAGTSMIKAKQFLADRGAGSLAGNILSARYASREPMNFDSISEWMIFDLPPADVPRLNELLTQHWKPEAKTYVLDDIDANHVVYLSPPEDTKAPSWWNPAELNSVDVLRVLDRDIQQIAEVYVADRKTGRVYVRIPGW